MRAANQRKKDSSVAIPSLPSTMMKIDGVFLFTLFLTTAFCVEMSREEKRRLFQDGNIEEVQQFLKDNPKRTQKHLRNALPTLWEAFWKPFLACIAHNAWKEKILSTELREDVAFCLVFFPSFSFLSQNKQHTKSLV
jgi:hypothetical protein